MKISFTKLYEKYIAITLALYIFSRLSWGIIIPSLFWGLVIGIAGIFAVILFIKNIKKSKDITVLLSLFIVICIIFNRNYDLMNNTNETIVEDILPIIIGVLIYCAFISYDSWRYVFKSSSLFLSKIHSIATIILVVCPTLYYMYILPPLRNEYYSIYKNIPNPLPSAGITADYGFSACFIVFGLCISFASVVTSHYNRKNKLYFCSIVTCIYMLFSLILNTKRSAFLGIIIAFLCFYITYVKKRGKFFMLILAVGIICIVLIISSNFVPGISNLLDRFSYIFSGIKDTNVSTRYIMWDFSFKGFLDSPLIGQGWRWVKNTNYYFGTRDVHNTYLQLLAENGILGSLPFFAFFIIQIKRAFNNLSFFLKRSNEIVELTYSVIGFLMQIYMIVYMTTTTFFYSTSMFMYYMMVSALVTNQYLKRANKN